MTYSDLVAKLAGRKKEYSLKDIEKSVKSIIELLSSSLSDGKRIEIRGFGSFTLHYRKERQSRNPKTGDPVRVEEKYVPRFKPSKELRERVNANFN